MPVNTLPLILILSEAPSFYIMVIVCLVKFGGLVMFVAIGGVFCL